jgi:ABC-type uncharacterized transport system permease subunit
MKTSAVCYHIFKLINGTVYTKCSDQRAAIDERVGKGHFTKTHLRPIFNNARTLLAIQSAVIHHVKDIYPFDYDKS